MSTLGEICEHYQLKRQCVVCELTAERDALQADVDAHEVCVANAQGLVDQYKAEVEAWRSIALKLGKLWTESYDPCDLPCDDSGCMAIHELRAMIRLRKLKEGGK